MTGFVVRLGSLGHGRRISERRVIVFREHAVRQGERQVSHCGDIFAPPVAWHLRPATVIESSSSSDHYVLFEQISALIPFLEENKLKYHLSYLFFFAVNDQRTVKKRRGAGCNS